MEGVYLENVMFYLGTATIELSYEGGSFRYDTFGKK